jgi:hypothetical protein
VEDEELIEVARPDLVPCEREEKRVDQRNAEGERLQVTPRHIGC